MSAKRIASFGLISCGILVLSGCGTSSTGLATSPQSPDEASAAVAQADVDEHEGTLDPELQAKLPPPTATPATVVVTFLNAARSGDETMATSLLTRKARRETEKEGLALEPPGTPTMKFEIGDVEIPREDPQAAYVTSIWCETDVVTPERFLVTWILRRQDDGWRIAGMANQANPAEAPLWLNFEDPEHVLRIKQEIRGEPENAIADDPLTAREPSTTTRR